MYGPFTDDFSHYGYIYPIHEQFQVLHKFKIFKGEVEHQHNAIIKVVCSNEVENITGCILLMNEFPVYLQNF
jgi:hypothetical protein